MLRDVACLAAEGELTTVPHWSHYIVVLPIAPLPAWFGYLRLSLLISVKWLIYLGGSLTHLTSHLTADYLFWREGLI